MNFVQPVRRTLVPVLAFAVLLTTEAHAATEITTLEFRTQGGGSRLEIKGNGPIQYTQEENPADHQVIINISDARLGPNAKRKLDTSSFDSSVKLVSPYQVAGQDNQVRIVVQLKDDSKPEFAMVGNSLTMNIGAPMSDPTPPADAANPKDPLAAAEEAAQADAKTQSAESTTPEGTDLNQQRLSSIESNAKNKKFTGKPITLQVRDSDVRDVLRLISDASGFNIIVGPQVEGKVSLSLVEVPWDQALDVVLQTLNLGAERSESVLRVMTLENLKKQKTLELEAKRASEAVAPRVTRIFPISYADPEKLAPVLEQFGKSSSDGAKPSVKVDTRTNSIVVQDISENLDRMEKLVKLLDTQTPQVMIESKIVEASEEFSKEIGGTFGFGNARDSQNPGLAFRGSSRMDNPLENLYVAPDDPKAFSANAKGANELGVGLNMPRLGFLPGLGRINALLQLNEAEGKVNVISAPKTVVLNKEKAKIVQGVPVPIQRTVTADGVTSTEFVIEQANIGLEVEATVTNDESVLLKLNIQRDIVKDFATTSAVGKRSMETHVLVENGETLVIGGIYLSENREVSSGFPILKDIPVLGVLFGAEKSSTSRSELFIFVSPQILNTKKSQLSDQTG